MKEISLLKAQMDKLDQKDFDLEAWKQYTVVLLSRIFGAGNPKIEQVEKIEYDYSSWSLRDTSGKSAYLETCKKLGREILQASIDELEAFGVPSGKVDDSAISTDAIISALEEELKVSQIRQLTEIISSDKKPAIKKKEIQTLIKSFEKGFAEKVLTGILSHPALSGKF